MQVRAGCADAGHDAFEQSHARRQRRAAIGPVAGLAGEQFVQQIAVAALHVDEVEARAFGGDGGSHELFADRFELRVGQQRRGGGQGVLLRQQRMVLRDLGRKGP